MPSLWAVTGFSIFIASSTTIRSPADDRVAVAHRDLDDRALHRRGDRVPGGLRRALAVRRACAARPCAAAAPPRRRARGRRAATPPAAGRRPRRPPTAAARPLSASRRTVERRDGVVPLGLDPPGVDGEVLVRRKPGRRRPAGGTAAPSPCPRPGTRPARGASAPAPAGGPSPVTISLASSESNCPPITEPLSTPASTRTPGPAGKVIGETVPGAGRKPRPGVFAVDPELDRVPARLRVRRAGSAPRPRRSGTARARGPARWSPPRPGARPAAGC